MSEQGAIAAALHAYFNRTLDDGGVYGPGCIHFDKGFGEYKLCEDPDQTIHIRALPELVAAIRLSADDEGLRAALDAADAMAAAWAEAGWALASADYSAIEQVYERWLVARAALTPPAIEEPSE